MKQKAAMLYLLATTFVSTLFAGEGAVPKGVPHLDHVFVIMMENHGYSQIVNNPNAPFTNQYAKSANSATNYFAIAHPSLTNYLEVVGGSNFGVHSDNNPDWHNLTCITNLATGIANTDNPPSPNICPISGVGTDAETPAVDATNEVQGTPGENNIDGIRSIPAAANTLGETIADQLVAAHKDWKSYQEDLPTSGADMVNYSDGFYTDSTDFHADSPDPESASVTGRRRKTICRQTQPVCLLSRCAGRNQPERQPEQCGRFWRATLGPWFGARADVLVHSSESV